MSDGLLTDDQLTKAMREWRKLTERAGALQELIVKTTLAHGRSHKCGNVQAHYSKGRKSYDYAAVGRKAPASIIAKHTAPTTDWRAVCETALFHKDVIPFSEGEPRVSLRIKE
jgi:hypothetical protein